MCCTKLCLFFSVERVQSERENGDVWGQEEELREVGCDVQSKDFSSLGLTNYLHRRGAVSYG